MCDDDTSAVTLTSIQLQQTMTYGIWCVVFQWTYTEAIL